MIKLIKYWFVLLLIMLFFQYKLDKARAISLHTLIRNTGILFAIYHYIHYKKSNILKIFLDSDYEDRHIIKYLSDTIAGHYNIENIEIKFTICKHHDASSQLAAKMQLNAATSNI